MQLFVPRDGVLDGVARFDNDSISSFMRVNGFQSAPGTVGAPFTSNSCRDVWNRVPPNLGYSPRRQAERPDDTYRFKAPLQYPRPSVGAQGIYGNFKSLLEALTTAAQSHVV